ncbi:MAG: glycosyltransferase family 39 protein [Patescibacteria group bacterium]
MFKKNKSQFFILLFVISLGFLLRYHNYAIYPRHGATFDEFAWTWLGINLIQKGVPISWSPHPQYKERKEIRYQGAAFLIVKPYLEHPPLFGIVAGTSALLSGAKDMYSVTLTNMRGLSAVLGILSIVALFIFTNSLYGKTIAYVSTILYATVPTIVIGSRIVQNENFLIPFWLFSLYLINKYLQTKKLWMRNIASVIGGLLILAKVPWIVVPLSLGMILFYKGKWKDALFVGGVAAGFFSLFIAYGLYFDKELFVNLFQLQVARYDISFDGLFSIFTHPLLVDRYYLDGWILFGWVSIFYISKDIKKHLFVLLPFISYFVLYVFAIPNEPGHGWYRYPFYPFLISALAFVLEEERKKLSFLTLFFALIVGFALLQNVWKEAFGFSFVVYRSFILVVIVPMLYFIWKNRKDRMPQLFLCLLVTIFIIFNIFSVIVYVE